MEQVECCHFSSFVFVQPGADEPSARTKRARLLLISGAGLRPGLRFDVGCVTICRLQLRIVAVRTSELASGSTGQK